MGNKFLNKVLGNEIFRIIVSLAIVGSLSGMILVFVYNYAAPRIQQNMANETEKAIKSIFPGLESIKKAREEGVYMAQSPEGKVLGYAFIAEGNGYQGIIKIIAGVDPGINELQGMEVLESSETPGLGAEIANDPFRGQFNGLDIAEPIEYLKNQKPQKPGQIEAITGATISSRAVVNMLNKRISELREQKKGT